LPRLTDTGIQHFKCNLGEIRHVYPILNNWLKYLYWQHDEYRNTTDFRHIKENYTKSMLDINPKAITPLGPWPIVEKGYESDWSGIKPGEVDMPAVLEHEKTLE
jgi:glutathionyl-hydroquinone reductase